MNDAFDGIDGEETKAEDARAAKLVQRFQAGDREAFGELYKLYFGRAFAYLRMVLKDAHEAEDIAQESFTKALEALPVYEQRRPPFRAWLFTVVKNQALKFLRDQGRVEPMDPAELDRYREAHEQPAEQDLDALTWITDKDLLIFVKRLPPAQRQVLLMRYLLDMPGKQIAASLKRSHEDVRILQHRAIKFLRARLEAIGRVPSEQADASERGERERNGMKRWEKQAPVLRERRWSLM